MPIIEQFEKDNIIHYLAFSFGWAYNIGSASTTSPHYKSQGIDSSLGSYHGEDKEGAFKHWNEIKREHGIVVNEQTSIFDFI